MLRGACLGALLVVTSLTTSSAHAELAPVAVSIVPGLLVHGSGHFAAKQPATGRKLLAAEAVGIGMIGLSLLALSRTGASRRIVAPVAVTAVIGVGLFAFSALSDIYGVVAPDGGFGSPRARPVLETSAGVRGVYDPQFRYGAVIDESIDARWERLHLRGDAASAPSGGYSRLAALIGVALTRGLDLEGVVSHRAYRNDGFRALTFEARLSGRYDLAHFAPTLRGSFAELQVGAAVASYQYAHGSVEADDLLLLRVGYGMYLGRWSEASIYYDHRRDTIAGGALIPGIAAGYGGFVGLDARWFLDERWGVAFDARAGGAYLLGASLVFRQGASTW